MYILPTLAEELAAHNFNYYSLGKICSFWLGKHFITDHLTNTLSEEKGHKNKLFAN